MSLLSATSAPFQLLEINLISAKDLAPVSKPTKAYAVVSLPPHRKLTTQIDQDGDTNPTWNEKFVFRVDEHLLHNDDSTIIIDIYASSWLRDILIGTVGVLLRNLLPPSARSGNRKSKLQFVALQIRRPSGQPRGILNIGVNLVDSTKRSMPLYSELSASAVGDYDFRPFHKKTHQKDISDPVKPKLLTLLRSQSEKNDSTINDYVYHPKMGFRYNEGSEMGVQQPDKGVIVNANGSLCSDVGPSPSVVAAAIAKGLYPVPLTVVRSSGLDEWSSEKESSTEGVRTKIERWKTELPPVYDQTEYQKLKQSVKRNGRAKKNKDGACSCFGKVMGCEISINCGGGNRKKKHGAGKRQHTQSDLTYDESSYLS